MAGSEEYLRALLALEGLVGPQRWNRRMRQILGDAATSPYKAKIIADEYWIEIELAEQMEFFRSTGVLREQKPTAATLTALEFVADVTRVYASLTTAGRKNLQGRLRDGLNRGFSGLFIEIDTAATLARGGYRVAYPDFDGAGNYDLDIEIDGMRMAIECKSVSPDGGRKVKRADFYRFIDRLGPIGTKAPEAVDPSKSPDPVAVVITMDNRFPTNTQAQDRLAKIVLALLATPTPASRSGEGCHVQTESIRGLPLTDQAMWQRWGQNAHVAGLSVAGRARLVVVRSALEDDTSRVALGARIAAAQQLPSERPGMIVMQYNEIHASDLVKPSFRRRLALLDLATYQDPRAASVAAIYHCAYGKTLNLLGLGKAAMVTTRSDQHAKLIPRALGKPLSYAQFGSIVAPGVPLAGSDGDSLLATLAIAALPISSTQSNSQI